MSMWDPHLMSGAYAVDALDESERVEFEAHLAECPECAAEVTELQETAARLAVLSSELPPASLRESVLSGITSVRQLPPEHVATADDAGHDDDDDEDEEAVELPPIGRPGSSWQRRLAMPVAAALLGVLALTAGAWGLNQRDRADQISARSDLVTSVLTAPDARSSSAKVGSGRASLVVTPAGDKAVLVATDLDVPADGKVYQLWRVNGAGQAASAGVYVPSSNGAMAVPIDGSLGDTKTVAVTVEPKGGSDQPTSAPIGAFALA